MLAPSDKPGLVALLEEEGPREECAVFGIYGGSEASAHTRCSIAARRLRASSVSMANGLMRSAVSAKSARS